jgi:hypothetical protein
MCPRSDRGFVVIQQLNDGIRMLQSQAHLQNGQLRLCHTNCVSPLPLTHVCPWIYGCNRSSCTTAAFCQIILEEVRHAVHVLGIQALIVLCSQIVDG